MFHICLTGGPGSGKSTSMAKIESALTARGYFVFIVPETATEFIINGVHPSEFISMDDFQAFVLDKQLNKESLYHRIGECYPQDRVVILYDRGLGDQLAYTSKENFVKMLADRGLTLNDAVNRYDLVLNLTTAADGAVEHYEWVGSETCQNMARSESPEEAIEKDRLTLNGWVSAGCTHLKVIDNSTDFENKIRRILEEVFFLLDEEAPSEIERKYLIKKPTTEQLANASVRSKSNIIQTYLNSENPNIERRIRMRGTKKSGYSFYYTEKQDKFKGVRIERERKISQKEYLNYAVEADSSLHQISKERICFVYDKQFFELDLYPSSMSEEYAVLEIELKDINEPVNLPPFLDVVRDVTGENAYKNSSLAKTMKIVA